MQASGLRHGAVPEADRRRKIFRARAPGDSELMENGVGEEDPEERGGDDDDRGPVRVRAEDEGPVRRGSSEEADEIHDELDTCGRGAVHEMPERRKTS